MKTLRTVTLALCAALALGLAACGDHDHEHGDGDASHDHAAEHGGMLLETSDHSMHFEVKHDEKAGLLQVWVYDGEMKAVETGAPVIQLAEDSGGKKLTGQNPNGAKASHEWHFSDRVLNSHVHGRLRLSHDGKSYNVDLPDFEGGNDHGHGHDEHGDDHGDKHEDGHGHDEDGDHGHDEHGPHDGMVTAFAGADGKAVGHVELKLHDDKGDLELWLATDEGITKPFDLSLADKITVTFHGRDKSVTLAVRNTDKNEDEDGTANNRSGKTNYFIFPGDTGADASWLMGKDFSCPVSISFSSGGTKYSTQQFTLIPHTHHEGGHEHK